jgi:CubicO group peptidase (beta-lactamase class C family)/D-alanyl-D-alanine dipeptidase
MLRRTVPYAWSLLVAAWSSLAAGQAVVPPRSGLEASAEKIEAFIREEMKVHDLPAVSIALVEGKQVVWARGFGLARPKEKVPADAETVYRVGSVSKLFTDLAVMQLVERGELDLDAPVTRYLPDFLPTNPFGAAITLRQLMAHRSGLVRESPVGHYFDPTMPTLADTVRSLNSTTLVHAPTTRQKYSNAAIATVGRVVEVVKKEPFASYVQRSVIASLGMTSTSFEMTPALAKALAIGQMWTYDGRTFDAPTFPLGTSPAGNLYSTVLDLGRFLVALLDEGRGPYGPVVAPSTLHAMWVPQYQPSNATRGFGLGFSLSTLDGHRKVGHGGAVYGFATEVSALPDDGLGVAVVITKDCANTVASRIGDAALRMLLALKKGEPLPSIETTSPVATDLARRVDGRYDHGDGVAELAARADKLFLFPARGGFRVELRAKGKELVADDPLAFGTRVVPGVGAIALDGLPLGRLDDSIPEPPPSRWNGLIGEYGWDHNTLYILERQGKLYALIEWFFFDPLAEISPDVFAFPESLGLYGGEMLKFTRDATGRATQVEAAGVVFKRRKIDGDDGSTFHITPLRPVADLRPEALAASPPAERGEFHAPDLVDLTLLDPSIKLDIRYATSNNFLGTPFYSSARAFLQGPAAEALVRAHQGLKARGYGLLIHDAYRPWHVTKMFWDATPDSGRGFVADPSKGSKHNRGCAVDLTLYDLANGKPIEMPGGYDEFSTRSSPDYPGGTSRQRTQRDLLRRAMEAQGFTVNEVEWWHFDYKDWSKYPILNATFEQLAPR